MSELKEKNGIFPNEAPAVRSGKGMILPRLEKDIFIRLSPVEVILIFQTVLDEDNNEALRIITEIFDAKIRKALNQPHCRPMFEFPKES